MFKNLFSWVSVRRGKKSKPQGLKPIPSNTAERPKAEALGYLEAKAYTEPKPVIYANRSTFSLKRWMQAGVVCLLAVVMLGADTSSRFNRVGHQMMCVCGCGQVLLECNHVGCPDSDRMIGELRGQVSSGGTDTSILNWFTAKYGATVLAAPIRGGFDNVAWITPMAVFLFATLGVGFLIRMWKLRSGGHVPVSAAEPVVGGDALRERIRRETEY
jgi:cytochrome c-type biogenesis protein CcmH/NrfF